MSDLHIPIERRFHPYPKKNQEGFDFDRMFGTTYNWSQLYQFKCVVILAEGKSGKTHEFRQQHSKLRADNKFSFFIPLELLHDHELLDTISSDDELELDKWQQSDEEATFFLDAIDELKLRQGTLRKAIRKIETTLNNHLIRAHFFISCRPFDWEDERELDLNTVKSLIVHPHNQKVEQPDSEALFNAVITKQPLGDVRNTNKDEDSTPKLLTLQPLSKFETIEFAQRYKPTHVKALETYLNKYELWHLYQTPQQIITALNQLESEGALGTAKQQLIFEIKNDLKEQSDKKRVLLNENNANEGAERLALALLMMKKRSIYRASNHNDPSGVCVTNILTDWSAAQCTDLLSKPLFDPTGVGALRFAHRDAQEYLAAQRLTYLEKNGLGEKALFDLLFDEINQEKVVKPTLAPVTVWLALENTNIMKQLLERQPQLLFRQGIPATLDLETRKALIGNFVHKFANSGWRDIYIRHDDLQRLATPELSHTIQALWQQAYTGFETRELLLTLIYKTPLADCSDLALQAALDSNLPPHHRSYAIKGVFNSDNVQHKRKITESLLRGGWPTRIVRFALTLLFPAFITVEQFITLIATVKQNENEYFGLENDLVQIIKDYSDVNSNMVELRDELTKLIWANKSIDKHNSNITSNFAYLKSAIIIACSKTLPTNDKEVKTWINCVAIIDFIVDNYHTNTAQEELNQLKQQLTESLTLREAFYWQCFDIANELTPFNDDWQAYVSTYKNHWLWHFTIDDAQWLLKALAPNTIEKHRGVAFYALRTLLLNGANPQLVKPITELITDREDLAGYLQQTLAPPSSDEVKYQQQEQERQAKRNEEETKRVNQWTQWRKKVLANAHFSLEPPERDNTLHNVCTFLKKEQNNSTTKWGYWDAKLIENTFNQAFLTNLRAAAAAYWRASNVKLYSEKTLKNKNSYPQSSLVTLMAIKCDAENKQWSQKLTHQEAIKACRIATIELNDFAYFIEQLEQNHQQAIDEVITKELTAQFKQYQQTADIPLLSKIASYDSTVIQKSAVKVVMIQLPNYMDSMANSSNNYLKNALQLIAWHGSATDKTTAISWVTERFNKHPKTTEKTKTSDFWLPLLAMLSFKLACETVLVFTKTIKHKHHDAEAIFANVFAGEYGRKTPSFADIDIADRLKLLKALVIRAFQLIKPDEDIRYEGVHNIDTRDRAELARRYLFDALTSTQSEQTLVILNELANLPEFTYMTDRLKQTATELAAQIADKTKMSATEFCQFDQTKNHLPTDNQSLFKLMNNRLADFEHHLLNDQFSIIDILKKVDSELELRRFIAYWLSHNSDSAYTVTQETVVIGEKRTDIRLHVQDIGKEATIELKLDGKNNRWTAKQLKDAVEKQLIGQYLNHQRSQAGCLLICLKESRRWRNPDTNKMMDLATTVEWLQEIAKSTICGTEKKVSVKGIDFSKMANNEAQ